MFYISLITFPLNKAMLHTGGTHRVWNVPRPSVDDTPLVQSPSSLIFPAHNKQFSLKMKSQQHNDNFRLGKKNNNISLWPLMEHNNLIILTGKSQDVGAECKFKCKCVDSEVAKSRAHTQTHACTPTLSIPTHGWSGDCSCTLKQVRNKKQKTK